MTPTGNLSAILQQEEILRDAWNQACLPLRDTRREVMELYEEQKLEAREELIEFLKLHPEAQREVSLLRLAGQALSAAFKSRAHIWRQSRWASTASRIWRWIAPITG